MFSFYIGDHIQLKGTTFKVRCAHISWRVHCLDAQKSLQQLSIQLICSCLIFQWFPFVRLLACNEFYWMQLKFFSLKRILGVDMKLPAKCSSTHRQIHISVNVVQFDGIWTKPNIIRTNNFPMVTGITNTCNRIYVREFIWIEQFKSTSDSNEWSQNTYHHLHMQKFLDLTTMDLRNDESADFYWLTNVAIESCHRILLLF